MQRNFVPCRRFDGLSELSEFQMSLRITQRNESAEKIPKQPSVATMPHKFAAQSHIDLIGRVLRFFRLFGARFLHMPFDLLAMLAQADHLKR